MTNATDTDIKVLKACVKALMRSSSAKMLIANLEYLTDRFLAHPSKDVVEKFYRDSASDKIPKGPELRTTVC